MPRHIAARIIRNIESQTRYRLDQAIIAGAAERGELGVAAYLIANDLTSAAPALDVADLAAMFRTDPDLAYAEIARLSAPQLVVEAAAYAAYASELLSLNVAADEVLEFWLSRLRARGLAA